MQRVFRMQLASLAASLHLNCERDTVEVITDVVDEAAIAIIGEDGAAADPARS
jgi:hypothetical protein